VRTIADFTAADRIAVPSVRASVQAIILEMATARTFGADNWGRLDPLTVSLGHPDALVAMLSGRSEITAHFAPAPFYQQELQAPGTHVVLRTDDVFGGPLSNGILWTTTRFHSEHQEIVRSVLAALEDAMTLIHHDPRRAAEDYLALSKDKPGVAELTEMIRELDASFDTVPHGTKAVADFMHRIGAINVAPARWQDMFFPEAWTRPGS
jgi:NitT/TauT family transport system substrate-binding protein